MLSVWSLILGRKKENTLLFETGYSPHSDSLGCGIHRSQLLICEEQIDFLDRKLLLKYSFNVAGVMG